MIAHGAQQFEMQLREICDRAFERPSLPGNSIQRLLAGELGSKELSQLFAGMWNTELFYNEVILPRALERCPDVDARVQIWRAAYPAYGRGALVKSHPYLLRTFLTSIGLQESDMDWSMNRASPDIQRAVASIDEKAWIEMLVGDLLGPQSIPPKLYGLLANALQSHYGLRKENVAYFLVQHQEGQANTEILFALVARYCNTVERQELARRVLREFFEQERSRMVACNLAEAAYAFVRVPEGLPRSVDRRRGVRQRVELRVRIMDDIKGSQDAITQNVSTSGLLLRTRDPRRIGSSLVMVVTDAISGALVEISGRVVRVESDADGKQIGIGIEFDARDFLTRQMQRFLTGASSR